MAVLRVKSGPQKGKWYDVRGDSQILGRDTVAEIQILDQGVSRKHAEVFRIGEMFFIRDLQSRNHTYVNQKEVSEEILKFGDQITIGNTVLILEDHLARLRDSKQIVRDVDAQPAASPSSTIVLKLTKEIPGPGSKLSVEERNLEILLHLSHIVAEEKNLSRLFTRVSELVGKSLGADHLYILGLAADGLDSGSDGNRSEFEVLGRYDQDNNPDREAGVSRGIINDCLTHNRSVLTSDASLDQQFNAMASVVMKQLRSVICVPISALQKNIGVIYIYSNRADTFGGEDLELASAVGIHLGSTIELLKLLRRSDQFFRNSIKTLVSAIEMANPGDRGKSERVATYCLAITKEMGLSTQDIRDAWLTGMLHDIGSIPMTEQERANLLTLDTKKNHYAKELLGGSKGIEQILPALEEQGERHDGSGSPEGKQGDQISTLGRILSLALELETLLVRGGPDGAELSVKETLLKIKEMADRQFERRTVNALLIAYRSGKLFNQSEEFFEIPTS